MPFQRRRFRRMRIVPAPSAITPAGPGTGTLELAYPILMVTHSAIGAISWTRSQSSIPLTPKRDRESSSPGDYRRRGAGEQALVDTDG